MRERPTADAPPAPAGRVAPVVVTLGVVSLLTDVSSESVSAILPLYLTAVLGFSTVAYGFLDGLYQGVSALVRIAGGWAADHSGHPKWVALLGYAASCAARFALLFATGLGAITAVVAADRIGKGIRTAPRDAMIHAATPSDHLGRAFGVHRTLDTLGAALGPLIAFAILWWIPDGYHLVMVVSLASAVIGVALLGLLVSDPTPRGRVRTPRTPFAWRELLDRRQARLLAAAGGLGLLTIGDGFLYLALLDRGGFAAHWFPLLYVGTNLAYLALALPLGRLGDRVGRARVLVLGHLALAAAYLCAAAPLPSLPVTLAAVCLLGAFYAATDGVLAAVAGRLAPPHLRASGIAAAQTTVAVARMFASLVFGIAWSLLGSGRSLLVAACLLGLLVPLAYRAIARVDQPVAVGS